MIERLKTRFFVRCIRRLTGPFEEVEKGESQVEVELRRIGLPADGGAVFMLHLHNPTPAYVHYLLESGWEEAGGSESENARLLVTANEDIALSAWLDSASELLESPNELDLVLLARSA